MYDESPAAARVPLTSQDVEALLLTDGADIAADPRRVRHLLTRMRATLAAHLATTRSLQRDLEVIVEGARRRAHPVAGALEALAQCTYQEQRQVYDRRAQVLIDKVEQSQRDAEEARVAAASETNRARLVLASAAQIPELSDQVRQALLEHLAQVPLMHRPVPPAVGPVDGAFTVGPRREEGLTDVFA